MTGYTHEAAALQAGHKQLAHQIRQDLLSDGISLSHVQCLHVVAALYGLPNWNTLQARPHAPRLPLDRAVPAVTTALSQRMQQSHEHLVQRIAELPTPLAYTVLNEDRTDNPMKSQVALSILLIGEITEPSLRTLLKETFHSQLSRTDFSWHPHPNSIFIWAYASEGQYQSGAGQWAGMIMRSAHDTQVGNPEKMDINPGLIRALSQPKEERFGLSDSERRLLFLDHCRATNRARIAADDAFPIGSEDTRRDIQRNQTDKRARLDKLDAQLATRYKLTIEQLQDILVEGMTQYWPMGALTDTRIESLG